MSMERQPRFVSQLTRNTLALILAGGRGSRLKKLYGAPSRQYHLVASSELLISHYLIVLIQVSGELG